MTIAHEVAICDDSIAHSVESSLRQRLGQERMDLWFGANAKWTVVGNNEVCIEVSSPFLADCISKMFRKDLQAVLAETAGPEFGFRLVVAEPEAAEGSLSTDRSSIPSRSSSAASSVSPSIAPSSTRHPSVPNSSSSNRNIGAGERNSPSVPMRTEEKTGATLPFASVSAPSRLNIDAVRNVRNDSRLVDSVSPNEPNNRNAAPVDIQVDRLLELRRENEKRWDEFVPGDCNRLAYTACQMVLERPGQTNPLLLHGPSGVGKTHLAVGLAHKLRQMYRMRRVLTLTGEQFTIEYTESARGGGFASFRRKYRDVEAIVIDDIQFCLGKAGTLVELRNTIDMLLRDRRQIILVSDRGLSELGGLGTDLYARLSGGMACSLDPIDVTTRQTLLEQLCNKQNIALSPSTYPLLASQCGGDARVLHGIVHRLAAQQRVLSRQLTDDEALRCSLDLIRASQPVVRMTDIEKVVCDAFGLDDKMLRAKSKCQSVSQPRMLAMFLARKYTRTALSEIGEYFGNRQHSTVISAQKKVECWLESDEVIGCGRTKVAVRDILKNLEATLQVG